MADNEKPNKQQDEELKPSAQNDELETDDLEDASGGSNINGNCGC